MSSTWADMPVVHIFLFVQLTKTRSESLQELLRNSSGIISSNLLSNNILRYEGSQISIEFNRKLADHKKTSCFVTKTKANDTDLSQNDKQLGQNAYQTNQIILKSSSQQ